MERFLDVGEGLAPSRALAAGVLVGCLLTLSAQADAAPPTPTRPVETVPLNHVRLLDGPFKDAQDRNLAYVLAMDPDRLLAPYLLEAGLEPPAENYGNWEDTGLNGHIGGHYLTALSLAWAATGRQDVLDRLDHMLAELKRAQDANGNGYLGGVPNGDELWRQIAAGDVRADLFSLNGSWVPWYNLHKTFAGLRDAWLYAQREPAREMLVKLSDWAAGLVSELSDEQVQAMLRAEHGGMNEVLADVAAISGDDRFLRLAERFSHRAILEPLEQGEDRLDGLHANTQIPKVIGYERVAELGGPSDWHRAAEFFWDNVVHHRTVAFGGNSVREHFHPTDDFEPMIRNVEGPETCNTYNMLRLTRLLYQASPELEYVDYAERALYNHILASQDPATGGLVYFTPLRPQHYRVYSQVHTSMWCCVGSGIENHFKYGETIYARDTSGVDAALYVNLFIASRVEWPEKGLVLRQETEFPDRPSTRLVFESDTNVGLKLRYPSWATSDTARVRINGAPQNVSASPGSYIELRRDWKAGDVIELDLPMTVHSEPLPDGSDYYAILYGPIVLAAKTTPFPDETLDLYADDSRMGHIPAGASCPLESAPILVADTPDIAKHVQRIESPDDDLRFRFDDILQSGGASDGKTETETELIPFFRLHHARYMLYWPYSTPEDLATRRAVEARAEAARAELEALTIDQVAPGEQQPEAEHDFAGVGTEAGLNFDRHWRHADEWFGYTLSDPDGAAQFLRITYWGADAGRRFRIEMDGVVVAEVHLQGKGGPEFVDVDYAVPTEVREASADGTYELRFIAAEESIAGGIYGVRLLSGRPKSQEQRLETP